MTVVLHIYIKKQNEKRISIVPIITHKWIEFCGVFLFIVTKLESAYIITENAIIKIKILSSYITKCIIGLSAKFQGSSQLTFPDTWRDLFFTCNI